MLLQEQVEEHPVVLNLDQIDDIVASTIDEILGFGPLERLLNMDGVSDILINGPDQVFVEVDGKLQRSEVKFRDAAHLVHIVRRIVSTIGRRIDEFNPLVDARLPDGTRLNAVIAPIALNGASLSLRRFNKGQVGPDQLVEWGCASREVMNLLEACVRGRLNVLVIGGTGSGKTTLLNILSGFIPETDRILTIEDAAELVLRQEHVVRLETRPANIEGKGEIDTRILVKNALRMRPDRIVVGEIRGKEAIDMLQALNTGHDGSMSTVHANSARHAISRLQVLVGLDNGNMSVGAIREVIADALDLIVHVKRCPDGVRRIMSVTEVLGMENGKVSLQEIMSFQVGKMVDDRLQGVFSASGVVPGFADRLASIGVVVPPLSGSD
jgi:pilus assembly protein CpaF